MDAEMTFGQRIERLRTERGLTMSRLAFLAGITLSAQSYRESRVYNPTYEIARAYAALFNVTIESIAPELVAPVQSTPLGERLHALRLEQQLSQFELARLANVSQNFISSIEKGTNVYPRIHGMARIAHALGVPLDAFVSEDMFEGSLK